MIFTVAQNTFAVSFAQTETDLRDAQALRYEVFIDELGGDGPGADHAQRLETDQFDAFADHLLLRDAETSQLVGVYRILTEQQANRAGGFSCEPEYDLSALKRSGQSLLELGRSCLRRDVRGTTAMYLLWSALETYVQRSGADVLFGVASLPGTEIAPLASALSLLNAEFAAPENLRPKSRHHQPMDLVSMANLDRKAVMLSLPPLLKGYLRLGGLVGDGAFVDHAFNCTDVCLIMDTATMNEKQARLYQRFGAP